MKITSETLDNILAGEEEEDVKKPASPGHKLGQLVGDWFQDDFVQPILSDVAKALGLYLDHRENKRSARGDKIIWKDEYGNEVDYDFVLELGGSDTQLGIPVAFLECFWRRGSRHSKEKARDDSGKLVPMRHSYPTARCLGIIASGDFTQPARDLIRSREIDLFYVPKQKVIDAFISLDMKIDYHDKSSAQIKDEIVKEFSKKFNQDAKSKAAKKLRDLMTETVINGYVDRMKAMLSALPQEIRIILHHKSTPVIFETADQAQDFLTAPDQGFDMSKPIQAFTYQVLYSDGMEFSREVDSLSSLAALNSNVKKLTLHMEELMSSA